MFSYKSIKLESVDSTNNYIIRMKGTESFKEGLVVTTNYQTKGNGQRGKIWESSNNNNLLISILIEPNFSIEKQFSLVKCVSLALCDMLNIYSLDVSVKWPNDILVGKRKIAGILIQNILKGDKITHSIIGIGLNVNQTIFQNYSPEATSLSLLLDRSFRVLNIQDKLLSCFFERITQLRRGINHHNEYLSALFLRDMSANFENKGKKFIGVIKDVDDNGRLKIQLNDNTIMTFSNQEIRFLF